MQFWRVIAHSKKTSEAVNYKAIFDEYGWDFSFGAGFSNLI